MGIRLTEINQINKKVRLELSMERIGEDDLRIAYFYQTPSDLTQRSSFAFKSSLI